MEFTAILFYLFASLTVVSALAVISAKNPVYSVLWLIFAFFNSAALFLLLKAELIAMLMVIVYVGAVAVLFLFVVMMLNIRVSNLKKSFASYFPLGIVLALALAVEMGALIVHQNNIIPQKELAESIEIASEKNVENKAFPENPKERKINHQTNTHQIGNILYTKHILFFQTCGLILLVAMIGAIVLTLRTRTGVRKQNISEQISRTGKRAIKMVNVEAGKGV